jgi:hypothetical protein
MLRCETGKEKCVATPRLSPSSPAKKPALVVWACDPTPHRGEKVRTIGERRGCNRGLRDRREPRAQRAAFALSRLSERRLENSGTPSGALVILVRSLAPAPRTGSGRRDIASTMVYAGGYQSAPRAKVRRELLSDEIATNDASWISYPET